LLGAGHVDLDPDLPADEGALQGRLAALRVARQTSSGYREHCGDYCEENSAASTSKHFEALLDLSGVNDDQALRV
jgi:hypothetical protein